jgi:signal transduction histidine kinase
MASDEQLETIFENLLSNSVRAIAAAQVKRHSFIGKIDIIVEQKEKSVEVIFTDNGVKYDTVSGRGINQIETEMQSLKGEMHISKNPYQTHLVFPLADD